MLAQFQTQLRFAADEIIQAAAETGCVRKSLSNVLSPCKKRLLFYRMRNLHVLDSEFQIRLPKFKK